MGKSQLQPSILVLSDTFAPLVVKGDGIEVEFHDGKIHVRSGEIVSTPFAIEDTASPVALKVGDVVQEGSNAGWIYCETKRGEGFLVAPKDNGVMRWHEAMNYVAQEKAELPMPEHLAAMYETRDTGALKGTFNLTGSYPAGWYWSAAQHDINDAWCQNFHFGNQFKAMKDNRSSVRCVRRYRVAWEIHSRFIAQVFHDHVLAPHPSCRHGSARADSGRPRSNP